MAVVQKAIHGCPHACFVAAEHLDPIDHFPIARYYRALTALTPVQQVVENHRVLRPRNHGIAEIVDDQHLVALNGIELAFIGSAAQCRIQRCKEVLSGDE